MTQAAAIWTMVRDEDYFLRLWVRHYSRFVPRDHLFILVDGADSALPDCLDGCQVIPLPRSEVRPGWDKRRWGFLSHFASALALRFDVVIGGDVDELIGLDPAHGDDPIAYILDRTTEPVVSPFAVEVCHRVDLEPPLDPDRPVLQQRRFGRLNASYCKPCIHRVPLQWSIGQHYADFPELALSKSLYLFHLRYVDKDMLLARQAARQARITDEDGKLIDDAAGVGWQRSRDEMEHFLQGFVDRGAPEDTDFTFGWQRQRIERSWHFDPSAKIWRHRRLHNRRTYKIPPRFAGLF